MKQDFVGNVTSVIVGIIVVCGVALPIVTANLVDAEDVANGDVINAVMGIIPVFLILAILIGCVAIMRARKQ